MIAFKFKITFEADGSFLREIEFSSDQTFEEFHNYIIIDLNLDKTKPASFYLCDHKFRKYQEITLTAFKNNEQSKPYLMKDHSLSDLIDDPHQKLIYIFDPDNNLWVFFIELIKIVPAAKHNSFPQLIKKAGGIPSDLKPKKPTPPNVEENNDESENTNKNEKDEMEDFYTDEINNFNINNDIENRTEDNSFEEDE